VHEAGAWSLSGSVADGLADAVPLDGLAFSGEAPADVYQIAPPPGVSNPVADA